MRYAFALLPFLVFVATPCEVTAQPPGRGGGTGGPPTEMIMQLFGQADANNDGNVTKEELMAAMRSDRGGNRQGRRGPPNGGPPNGAPPNGGPPAGDQQPGAQGQHGPPSRPGEVLPTVVMETLNLNDRQKRQLTALQKDVDKRLATILTDEQKQQLENHRPPGGENGGPGDGNGRPQRPQ